MAGLSPVVLLHRTLATPDQSEPFQEAFHGATTDEFESGSEGIPFDTDPVYKARQSTGRNAGFCSFSALFSAFPSSPHHHKFNIKMMECR
jgi:hypothetical protein